MNCRHCDNPLETLFLDLGFAPPSNAYLTADRLSTPELCYPLRVFVCRHCWLVQTEDFAKADELFSNDYAYFSSTSESWLSHAAQYSEDIIKRLSLTNDSLVIEIASNDGYLLKNFVNAGIPCLGIEPTLSTAKVAESIGVPVMREFFSEALSLRLVDEGKQADLIIGNNVYAHVPAINDFTRGLKKTLKPGGVITLEFPHLLRLIELVQFDTIYHEHFSYLSLNTVDRIFNEAGLRIWDVEQLNTHGGSLRIFGCHAEDSRRRESRVNEMIEEEKGRGLANIETYLGFQGKVNAIKDNFLLFLIEQKKAGKKIVGYGAAAKGNTLLNYAGVRPDLLPYICDAATSKQGCYMPGSHIPIVSPTLLREDEPDGIVIFPWNIADEVGRQLSKLQLENTTFWTVVPRVSVWEAQGQKKMRETND